MGQRLITIVEEIDDTSIDEIDFDLQNEIHPEYQYDDENFEHPEMTGANVNYGEPINLDRLLKHLLEQKEKGATHVSMDYHEDHIGYEIQALKLTKASIEKVKEIEQKEEDERNKKKEKQLQKLRDEIDKLNRS